MGVLRGGLFIIIIFGIFKLARTIKSICECCVLIFNTKMQMCTVSRITSGVTGITHASNLLPAICYLMHRLKQDNPDTKIIFIGNSGLKPEIIDCMRDAAKQIGVEFIGLDEVEKENVHPTILGMEQIYDQIMQNLNG